MKKRIGFGFTLMLLACAAWAGGQGAARKQAEASMLITGTIGIAPDGMVSDAVLDSPEKIPPGVVDMVQEQVRDWRFEPYDSGLLPDGLFASIRTMAVIRAGAT